MVAGRPSSQLGEDAGEVLALVGEEFRQGFLTAFEGGGEDHLAHGIYAVAFEEHVLGATFYLIPAGSSSYCRFGTHTHSSLPNQKL
jgi:hypothetical protein